MKKRYTHWLLGSCRITSQVERRKRDIKKRVTYCLKIHTYPVKDYKVTEGNWIHRKGHDNNVII